MSHSLREAAGQYLRFARENPALAGDANALARLEESLYGSFDEGFVALTAPNSPYTWEVRAILSRNDADTQRVDYQFPFAVNVVGFRATLVAVRPLITIAPATTPLPTPTLDDIDVQLDINNSAMLNNSSGLTTVTGRGGNTFVTLSGIDVQSPRTHGIRMEGDSKPSLGFTFRWKQPPPTPPADPFWQDVFLTVVIFAYPANKQLGGQTSKGIRGT